MADLQDVQDGQLIPVGSKEIEITGSIDKNEWDAKVKKHCFYENSDKSVLSMNQKNR